MFTFTTSVKNYIQVFLYVSSLKPKVIFSPEIASGRFTNIPSDANKSNFLSSDMSFNLFFKSSSRYLAPCVLNNLFISTPVFSIISSNSFLVCVEQYR